MIEIQNISKTFHDRKRGAIHAVQNVSLTCKPGEVFGLLGPNGAGKTTLLRMIATAIKPTEGTGAVCGYDLVNHSNEVRHHIGFLTSNTGLYPRLTPRETLRYFGQLFGMSKQNIGGRIEELSALFELEEFLDRPCDKLSTGMKQRVNIARTLLHDPPVLVLDEPTAGLDVLASRTIVNFIHDYREKGRTILFSTHQMHEVEKLCDRLALIHKGQIVFQGTTEEMRNESDIDLDEAFLRLVGEIS